MGEEKLEHNETKLSNQSGYSPVKQHDDIQEEENASETTAGELDSANTAAEAASLSPTKKKNLNNKKLTVDIPNGKHGKFRSSRGLFDFLQGFAHN